MRIAMSTLRTVLYALSFPVFAAALLSCQPAIPAGTDRVSLSYTYAGTNPVYEVDFGDSDEAAIDLHGVKGKSVYLVRSNPSAKNIRGIGGVSDPVVETGMSLPADSLPAGVRPVPASVGEFNARAAPRGTTRTSSNTMTSGNISEAQSSTRGLAFVPYGFPAPGYTEKVSYKDFQVQNAAGEWESIRAHLQAVGAYCYIWVADDNYNALSTASNDNLVTSAQAYALRDKFDGLAVHSYNDGIFRATTRLFGYEYGGGPDGDGGRDADQHVSILVYDIDSDYSAGQESGIFGFFWGKDYFTQAQLDTLAAASGVPALRTNNAEIMYLDANFLDRTPGQMNFTIIHEYQHMIHYNRKNISLGLDSPTWYSELCSLQAEDLVGANVGLDLSNYGPQTWLPVFCRHYAQTGVTDWYSGTAVYAGYASVYAFGAYLARNYGGAPLIAGMLANDCTGIPSVTKALAAMGSADTFGDAFDHYGESLIFRYLPPDSKFKTLLRGSTYTTEGVWYNLNWIDLDAYFQYDIFTKTWAHGPGANAPILYDPSTIPSLRPWGISIHALDSWLYAAADFSIVIPAPADPAVRTTIIVR